MNKKLAQILLLKAAPLAAGIATYMLATNIVNSYVNPSDYNDPKRAVGVKIGNQIVVIFTTSAVMNAVTEMGQAVLKGMN